MKILSYLLIFCMILSFIGIAYSEEVSDDNKEKGGSSISPALTGALLGGLLGGGIGTAIGSASGHAGTGALIGAGVGAVGGTVVGASQAQKPKQDSSYQEAPAPKPIQKSQIKKKVVREYDEQGNVVSEREVKQ